MKEKRTFPEHETAERDELKREIAAQHAEDTLRAKDPSVWQWAKAYDYVEEQFGNELTETLRSIAEMGRQRKRVKPSQDIFERGVEVSFA